jgi:hypothetical protein
MAAFRYLTDFESDAVGDYWIGLGQTGGTYNAPRISTLAGKKVATAVGYYTAGQGCWLVQNINQLSTAAAGKDIGDGWLVFKMRYRHVSQQFPIKIRCHDISGDTLVAYIEVDSGDNHYYFRARWDDIEELYVDEDLGISADDQFHNFEIRISKTKLACYVDSAEYLYDINPMWQPEYIINAYVFVNGWSYISYYEVIVTQGDIYGEDSKSTIYIDGVGVAQAAVKLFDTSMAPPTFELTTGIGGAIDYSSVDDGTYLVCGMDVFGYAFYLGEVVIASGEPV